MPVHPNLVKEISKMTICENNSSIMVGADEPLAPCDAAACCSLVAEGSPDQVSDAEQIETVCDDTGTGGQRKRRKVVVQEFTGTYSAWGRTLDSSILVKTGSWDKKFVGRVCREYFEAVLPASVLANAKYNAKTDIKRQTEALYRVTGLTKDLPNLPDDVLQFCKLLARVDEKHKFELITEDRVSKLDEIAKQMAHECTLAINTKRSTKKTLTRSKIERLERILLDTFTLLIRDSVFVLMQGLNIYSTVSTPEQNSVLVSDYFVDGRSLIILYYMFRHTKWCSEKVDVGTTDIMAVICAATSTVKSIPDVSLIDPLWPREGDPTYSIAGYNASAVDIFWEGSRLITSLSKYEMCPKYGLTRRAPDVP